MKVKELLAKINEMKVAGQISDESEVLSYADEFAELTEYYASDICLTSLSANSRFLEEIEYDIDRYQRYIAKDSSSEFWKNMLSRARHTKDMLLSKWKDALVI